MSFVILEKFHKYFRTAVGERRCQPFEEQGGCENARDLGYDESGRISGPNPAKVFIKKIVYCMGL
jgi:hypothetical protein